MSFGTVFRCEPVRFEGVRLRVDVWISVDNEWPHDDIGASWYHVTIQFHILTCGAGDNWNTLIQAETFLKHEIVKKVVNGGSGSVP